jgi:phage tail assembly protein T
MRLAREFRRPDWRCMLSSMSCSELAEWAAFYRGNLFSDALIDAEFSALSLTITSAFCGKTELTMADFSLLSSVSEPVEQSDEEMMLAAEGLSGGMRYGPVGG